MKRKNPVVWTVLKATFQTKDWAIQYAANQARANPNTPVSVFKDGELFCRLEVNDHQNWLTKYGPEGINNLGLAMTSVGILHDEQSMQE